MWLRTVSEADTHRMASALGAVLSRGMVLGLVGPLGAGKTCFARGFARGIGVAAEIPITSPTFTLLNIYEGNFPIYHLDLYRLTGLDDLESVGYFDLDTEGAVTLVEWAERVDGVLPSRHLRLEFHGEFEARQIQIVPAGLSSVEWSSIRAVLEPWQMEA